VQKPRWLDAARRGAHDPLVTGGQGVAARIAAFSLDDDGLLRWDAYLAIAVRGGLLVDLALAGRLAQTEDSIELDSAPIGWPPADRALAELESLDGQSLDWWLGHSHLDPDDVATALVQDGVWDEAGRRGRPRRPLFTERDPEPGLRDIALLGGTRAAETVEDAAVLSIIDASGVPDLRDPVPTDTDLLARTGPVSWVCELVIAYIGDTRAAERAVGSASSSELSIPPSPA
jgi:hypothetical protein